MSGDTSVRVADVLMAMVELARASGDGARAAIRVQAALDIYERQLPAHHVKRGKAANMLATVLFDQRDYARALEQFQVALQVLQNAPDPPAVDVAMAEVNIGETLAALARPASAIPHFERARDGFARTLGADHAYVAYALGHLGEAHLAARDATRALAAFERASSIYEKRPNLRGDLAADGTLSRWTMADDNVVAVTVPAGSSTQFVVTATSEDGREVLEDDYPLVNVEPMGSTTDD